MLAVNQWDEEKSTLERFARDGRLTQKILLDGSSVGSRYGVTGVPSSFWIDRNGIVVDSHTDFEGPEVLDRKTRKLLAK